MDAERRKLLVAPGSDVPVERLREALGDAFEIVEHAEGGEPLAGVICDPKILRAGVPEDLALVLAQIPDAVALGDEDGHWVWQNRAFEGLPSDVKQKIRTRVQRLDEDGSRASAEIDARNGEVFRTSISRVSDAGGRARYVVVARDISEDRRLAQRVEALNRAGEELLRIDKDQIRRMSVIDRLKVVEEKITKALHDLLHFDNFTIRLIDPSSGRLETVISRGIPEAVADLELYPEESGSGVSGWVASTGRSYICRDTENDPLFLPGMEGAASSLTVPLRLHDRIIGIMDIESTKPDAFSETDRRLAEVFARHIAMALHILDLLVVERSATNASACDRVEGELREPLDDILHETEAMIAEHGGQDPQALAHLERIREDVRAIRARMREVAGGPQTLLGIERAMQHRGPEPALMGKRVLVADDEKKIRRILGDVLRHRGCEVIICADGQEVMDRLEELDHLDLVISDIKLPDRNGYEIFHAARRAFPDVPVILMTGFGYDPHHSIVRASEEGLQAVLFKPFPIEKMLEEVRKAVGAPPPDA